MAAIKESFGTGFAGLSPTGAGTPTLAGALRDIADDLANGKSASIVSADASDLATAITLVNEIKDALNAVLAITILTTKG